MGASEYRGLIVIVLFISVALILIGAAVSETPTFFVTPSTGQAPSVPASQNPMGLLAWNITHAVQLNNSIGNVDYEFTGWTWTTFWDKGDEYIYIESYDLWWILHLNKEDFKWYNFTTGNMVSGRYDVSGLLEYHEAMPVLSLDSIYQARNYTSDLKFTCTNSKGTMDIQIDFNTTAYNNVTEALDGEGIFFSLYQDFGDRKTSINLLSVISGLFLGSIFGSNTLGIDPILSAIITIGLDTALAYIVFQIVRSLIPFLPGGG